MNNHDELSYIKIVTRIIEKMSDENSKMKRELAFHRFLLFVIIVAVAIQFWMGAK